MNSQKFCVVCVSVYQTEPNGRKEMQINESQAYNNYMLKWIVVVLFSGCVYVVPSKNVPFPLL